MNKEILKKITTLSVGTIGTLLLNLNRCYATSGGLPWEEPLSKVADSLTGPVVMAVCALSLATAGGALMFGEMGSGMKKLLQIVLGLSIATSSASLITGFMGFGGGVAF